MEDLQMALSSLNLAEMKGVRRKYRNQIFEKTVADTFQNTTVTLSGLSCPGLHIRTRIFGQPVYLDSNGAEIAYGTAGAVNVPVSTYKMFMRQVQWSSGGQEFANDTGLGEYFDIVQQEKPEDEACGDFVKNTEEYKITGGNGVFLDKYEDALAPTIAESVSEKELVISDKLQENIARARQTGFLGQSTDADLPIGKVCFYDSADHWGVKGMEAPLGYMNKVDITLSLDTATRLLVNTQPETSPASTNIHIRFKNIETITEFYELSPELDADTRQKKKDGTLLFAVRRIMRYSKLLTQSMTEVLVSPYPIISGLLLTFQNQGTTPLQAVPHYELIFGDGTAQYTRGGKIRELLKASKINLQTGSEEFPSSTGFERLNSENYLEYYCDVGVLRGKSIKKYPQRRYLCDKAVIPIDMSSSALYGWEAGEELRGYRFKSATDRNLTINIELDELTPGHSGYLIVYIVGYDIIRVNEDGIQKMTQGSSGL